jgi:hypothetical protein
MNCVMIMKQPMGQALGHEIESLKHAYMCAHVNITNNYMFIFCLLLILL